MFYKNSSFEPKLIFGPGFLSLNVWNIWVGQNSKRKTLIFILLSHEFVELVAYFYFLDYVAFICQAFEPFYFVI